MANVTMKAMRHNSSGSRPRPMMSACNQCSTTKNYAHRVRRPGGRATGTDSLFPDMNSCQPPDLASKPGRAAPRPAVTWAYLWLLAVVGMCRAAWQLFGHLPYRVDIDVYQMGAQAWLHHQPLYANGAQFLTPAGLNLPFTYPPLAAIVFCPFAWLGMPTASIVITLVNLVLLIISVFIVLTSLDVWSSSSRLSGPVWLRRFWLTLAVVAAATIWLEPIKSNFAFGQINVVLMTLVVADCLPRRTPWPRGVLLGVGIALKLTPAVFLLYYLLRRDRRAALIALASFAAATAAGFLLAWGDSWDYWTHTVSKTDRIGSPTWNTNQNIAGVLARLGLGEHDRFLLWLVGCVVVLAATVWATRRVLLAGEPALAVICVALFGLAVSPVSWSHHWVWMLPAVLVLAVLARRRRCAAFGLVSAAGVALMVWPPIDLMSKHHETAAMLWRQLIGASYLWWALAAILTAGAAVVGRAASPPTTVPEESAQLSSVAWASD
jgi:alpha-1,2-mannosyltransferase